MRMGEVGAPWDLDIGYTLHQGRALLLRQEALFSVRGVKLLLLTD